MVAVTADGQLMIGAWVSTTVTVKLHKAADTLSEQVTVVAPRGKSDPEGGVQVIAPH